MNLSRKLAIFLLLIIFITPLSPLMAAEFNSEYVISDEEFFDSTSLTKSEIQNFLNSKNSGLKSYFTVDSDGKTRSAAEIIYNAAQAHKINPKVILVLLQKEQSLVERNLLSSKQLDWALGYGVCDSCAMDDPAIQKFRGFANQVNMAAARMQVFANNLSLIPYKQTEYFDGQPITPANIATAILYRYTPHLAGNHLFWTVWQRWFIQFYPDGSLLKSLDTNRVYLIRFGEKLQFTNMSALISRYDAGKIITVTEKELAKYEKGPNIGLVNYSLVQDESDNIYLLVDDELRKIDSRETFRFLGFNPDDLIPVTADDVAAFKLGDPITMASAYPLGALLQNNKTGGVYYVENGVKHPLIAKEIMTINYPKYKLTKISPEELDKFVDGDLIGFPEGELLKSANSPIVYLVSAGQKSPIANEKTFKALGYQWKKIKVVSETALNALPLGPNVDLEFKQ